MSNMLAHAGPERRLRKPIGRPPNV